MTISPFTLGLWRIQSFIAIRDKFLYECGYVCPILVWTQRDWRVWPKFGVVFANDPVSTQVERFFISVHREEVPR